MIHKKITFIGAGNMAGSIISGLVKDGYPTELICASDPASENTQKLNHLYNIKQSQDNKESADWAEVIVLAVKPQIMGALYWEKIPRLSVLCQIRQLYYKKG